jgi:pyruvate kinase
LQFYIDTQGPKIHTIHLATDLYLKKGSVISIVVRMESDLEEISIHIDYNELINDIEFGIERDVDFIALLFVMEAADVFQLKELLCDKEGKMNL